MSYTSEVLADGPVFYARLGEASGTTLVDSSGNGRNGTYSGTVTHARPSLILTDSGDTATRFGNSGAGQAIVNYGSWMNTYTGFTAEFWITPGSTSNTTLFGRTNNGYQWYMGTQSNKFRCQVTQDGTFGNIVNADDPTSFSTGSVYHVVATHDGASTLKLYVNATLVRTVTATMFSDTAAKLSISEFGFNTNSDMDEVALYNYDIGATRIAAHYTAATVVIANFTGSGTLTSESTFMDAGTLAFSGSGTLTANPIDSAFFTGSGTLSSSAVMILLSTANFSGAGTLTIDSGRVVNFEMAIEILDSSLIQAPTTLTFSLVEGWPETPVDLYIDGILVWTAETNSDGDIPLGALIVDEVIGTQGTHTLTAIQDGSVSASADFTIARIPVLYPSYMGPDAQAVEVPGVLTSNGTRRWVFQDLLPEANGGIGSWIMPMNPKEMTSPFLEVRLASKHTTAVDGQWHLFEGGITPKEWTFSGYCPTQEMYEKLLAYRNLNRRFYIIDHRNRAWKSIITEVDFKAHLRENFNGEVTDWGHDYTVSAVALSQDWVVPA